ncbi:MAG: sugar ABC transporter ATP-binding protein [Spirochaetaceae bacterium]
MAENAILKAVDISKRFGGIQALDTVSTILKTGTVTALIGENGAGKSTLVKILAGYHAPDAGIIELDGKPVSLDSVDTATAHGIQVIHQTPAFATDLSVVDNVFLGQESIPRHLPLGLSRFDRGREVSVLEPYLSEYDATIDPYARLGSLRTYEQRLVGIIKALVHSARILIMDEPTAALPARERDLLLQKILQLKAAGYSILYVSHHLEEIVQVADEVVALRDGRVSGFESSTPTVHRMIELMTGADVSSLSEMYEDLEAKSSGAGTHTEEAQFRFRITPSKEPPEGSAITEPLSFSFQGGTTTLLCGIVGSGVGEVGEGFFGTNPTWKVEFSDGSGSDGSGPRPISSPKAAISYGIGYLPNDRRNQGVFPHFSLRKNLTLPALSLVSTVTGHILEAKEKSSVLGKVRELSVRCSSPEQPILQLSGGNQQKVMLARWLFAESAILILNEPTQGIDVNAKKDVAALLKSYTDSGGACVVVTTDPEEFLSLADRCIVMRRGRVVRDLVGRDISKTEITHAMLTQETEGEPS